MIIVIFGEESCKLITFVEFSQVPAQSVTCCRGSSDSSWTQIASGRFLGSVRLLGKKKGTEGKMETWKENKRREHRSNPHISFLQSSILHSFPWYIRQFHDTYKPACHTNDHNSTCTEFLRLKKNINFPSFQSISVILHYFTCYVVPNLHRLKRPLCSSSFK